ncbi:hypothetical protein BBJ29_000437 [Phytophthora kernoviae]|uniref:Uncharacterized protein n=1 Tax=Phytophthora kernoviae TaxID=325452 RepID=A0A3F2RSB8_9STRA|nr:hypothetical protein BBJ29_000437 [Phytophthora kernoviae]RLN63314.1 hypothetical protein BBP00_00004246 [Phytophthora kernoviae]
MVMRKLYKKNLSTEQTVVRLEQENAGLRARIVELEDKLNIAVAESERHKSNYSKMKADFQRLLGVKTTTLCENPTVISAGARELLQLMHHKMVQLDQEHTANVSLYNEQLYAVEQQTCESFAQKKLLEREMARIAQDVQQRDDLDLQIEKCMVGVFDRLHQVESENLQLKGSKPSIS